MHEDLLGYLLGALEPHEMRRVAQWLREDPAARDQLAEIQQSLKPLEESFRAAEPPPADLVSRTMASLPPLPDPHSEDADSDGGQSADQHESLVTPMAEAGRRGGRSHAMTWLDWVGGATAAAVLLGLLLPALAEGRFEARRIACQDGLRQFGTALTQFVNRDQQERLPAVAESGPEAFAGMYAVRLDEAGLIGDASIRWCPSLVQPAADQASLIDLQRIASIEQLHQASVDQLREIQRFAGGHYAYTLGVIEQDQLAPPRFESRSSFAVMSDAPLVATASREELVKRVGHSGAGINVLYEDGRVRFIPLAALDSMPDHPLLNHRGDLEAGVNIDDASLAPSWRPPFIDVRQR